MADGLTWPVHDVTQTVVEYPPGQQAGASLIRRRGLRGAVLRQVTGLARIRIILGISGNTVAAPAAGNQGTPSPGGSTAAPSRTAAQAACH